MTAENQNTRHAGQPPERLGENEGERVEPRFDLLTAGDVKSWRRAQRSKLRGERLLVSAEARGSASQAIAAHLRALLIETFSGAEGRVFSAYWPINGEPDLRPFMEELHASGVAVALPVVEKKAAPMVFRRWTPATKMVRGDWNIPVPRADSEQVTPDITLAPLVGWDGECYRLGYGGGYFDRTLASLDQRPFTIGIGVQSSKLETIHPQPHDIPLDVILTEAGVQASR